jgi:hypothetical protein
MYVHPYPCIYMDMHVYTYMSLYIQRHACICMYIYVYTMYIPCIYVYVPFSSCRIMSMCIGFQMDGRQRDGPPQHTLPGVPRCASPESGSRCVDSDRPGPLRPGETRQTRGSSASPSPSQTVTNASNLKCSESDRDSHRDPA